MVTKNQATDAEIDWDHVNRATEVARTYLVRDKHGNEQYKMYKPSEAQRILKERGWTGSIVSTLDRSHR